MHYSHGLTTTFAHGNPLVTGWFVAAFPRGIANLQFASENVFMEEKTFKKNLEYWFGLILLWFFIEHFLLINYSDRKKPPFS